MKWDEVIELEKRTEEDLYKINLILEGEFWHGYEWSAYLCNHFPSDKLGNEGALKPNRKKYNDGDIISVGLKFSSFDKYFPNIKDNDEICTIGKDLITIDAKDLILVNDIEDRGYEVILREWKENFKLITPKNKKKSLNVSVNEKNCDIDVRDTIFKEILNLELEKTTPLDALCFLSEIKHSLLVGENS